MPRSQIQWLAVQAVAISDSDAGPRCKDDRRGPTGAPAHVRRHVNLVMCWQCRFNGGGVQNLRPGARDIRICRPRNLRCFPRQTGNAGGPANLPDSARLRPAFLLSARIFWLDRFTRRADNQLVSSSVGWCRSMASRDPRTQELNNLKVALATFALQLDIFEARIRNGPPRPAIRPDRSRPPDLNFVVKTGPAMKSHPQD